MDEDILVPGMFFFTLIVIAIGVPLVRAYIRRQDRLTLMPPSDPALGARLERIEMAIEAVAVEVERISEGQRFVTRLLSEREVARAALPSDRIP